ncbi:unnamed protein product [Brachionus calyciflorus]|uniref:Uncharacterized protein n=1 Tax=Brachionus calyciflorus TaxID=104777 RepID=A0A813YJS7_9BILA|nr:unnamed protein product [Brachionus calyciflorus]
MNLNYFTDSEQKKFRQKRKADLNEIFSNKKHVISQDKSLNHSTPITSCFNDQEDNLNFSDNLIECDDHSKNFSENSDSDEMQFDKSFSKELIYPNSILTNEEFITLFEATVDKISIAESNREKLYKFIQLILPPDSNIPESYHKIRSRFKINRNITKILICSICKSKISKSDKPGKKKECSTETCLYNRCKLSQKYTIKIINSNLNFQIINILNNHYSAILNYQRKIMAEKNGLFFDIMSGNSYIYEPDTLNLILFADGVTYNKSGANSIWTIMSSIAELPSFLRDAFENIIIHSSWSGNNLDFNFWFQECYKEIDYLVSNGIDWSKAINSNQFNGYFGCIKCLHPGVRKNRIMIYPILPDILIRTNEKYKIQVNEASKLNDTFEGIKGPSFLSNWIKIPDNLILDYMHLSLMGTFKKIFNGFFESSSWQKNYYLGKVSHFIDNRLMQVKLPTEIKRKTRSIEDRYHFKANEFRTISFYLSFGLFKGLLNDIHLNNLMKYILFLRILCQDQIEEEEINDAQIIIIDFLHEYEVLYGDMNMTYNIHSHIHLAEQVKNFGPLSKISCFPFENAFKMTRDLFFGTRNFEEQIASNLDRRKIIRNKSCLMRNETKNINVKYYLEREILIPHKRSGNKLIDPKVVDINKLNDEEKFIINEYYQKKKLCIHTIKLYQCHSALNKTLEYHSFEYDSKFESLCNHLIQYYTKDKYFFGLITRFFSINDFNLVMIRKFEQKSKDDFFKLLSSKCYKYFDKFFQIGEFDKENILISLDSIFCRSLMVKTDEGDFLTPISYLNESD